MHPDSISPFPGTGRTPGHSRPVDRLSHNLTHHIARHHYDRAGKEGQSGFRQPPVSHPPLFLKSLYIIAAFICLTGLTGCLSSITDRFADNLSYAILNNNDLEMVEDGGPAYLIMIDAFLRDNDGNESLLRAGADLYSAYTNAYVPPGDRAAKLTDKALAYAMQAVCVSNSSACGLRELKFDTFETVIKEMDEDDAPALYTLGTTWAGWIQAHRQDWNAVAEIARVESIMNKMLEVDETYKDGGPHLYMGVLKTLLPPAMGGKPEEGRMHFERALEIGGDKNLMAKVIYARQYARLMFEQELHDKLLNEVISADPDVEGYTLINTLAQQQAKELLESGEDYF